MRMSRMSKERRTRAIAAWKMREEGLTGAEIAAQYNVTEQMISYDIQELQLEMRKEFFKMPPNLKGAVKSVFENIVTLQYKQLLAEMSKPKTTVGLLLAHAKFMATGVEAIADLIAECQREQNAALEAEAKSLGIRTPVDGYVDDLSRPRS